LELSASHRGSGLRLTCRRSAPGHIEPTKSRRGAVFAATQADRSNTMLRKVDVSNLASTNKLEQLVLRNDKANQVLAPRIVTIWIRFASFHCQLGLSIWVSVSATRE
jgi:hypothetical protein